jgi:uncharacterized protein
MAPLKPILSHFQTASILQSKQHGDQTVRTSIDLGLSETEVTLTSDGVEFSEGVRLSWKQIAKINSDKNGCFLIENNILVPVRRFSETTGRSLSLMPTTGAPALIVAGFPMHRMKNITPFEASKAMADTITPFHGEVLDTATGLGYAAIDAAQTAPCVITIELDETARELAELNPWSSLLFSNDKISKVIGDSFEVIQGFASEKFSGIIHDPPTMSLAGDLYSGEFYKQAFRVLMKSGKMFHYLGDPKSSVWNKTAPGVIRRLHDAGFKNISPAPFAHGVVAKK